MKDASGGTNLVGASVALVGADGTSYTGTTDGTGTTSLAGLAPGDYKLYGAMVGYTPASADLLVTGGADAATIEMRPGEIATATLDAHRLTAAEAIEAGIDPDDPDNVNVYKFEINLAFETPVTFSGIVTRGGFVGGGFGSGGGGGGGFCDTTCGVSGSIGGRGVFTYISVQYVQNQPQIIYITIPGEARWLKEFYDVTLTVQNLAPAGSGFVLTNGVGQLDLPSGPDGTPALALPALHEAAQDNPTEFPDVPAGESRNVHWIVRGDTAGLYTLTAHYGGVLQPVNLPVTLDTTTTRPIKVWGLEAAALRITADDDAFDRSPYRVDVALCNVTDSDPENQTAIYNVGVEFGEPTQHAIFQPQQQRLFQTAQLDPGECLHSPLQVIPNFTGHFRPDLSYVRKVADGARDNTAQFFSQPEIPIETRPRLIAEAVYTGGVQLTWDAVPGVTGYSIWQTGDHLVVEDGQTVMTPAPFGDTPLDVVGPEVTTFHVPVADGDDGEFAVLPILPTNHDMVHPLVQGVAPPPPPSADASTTATAPAGWATPPVTARSASSSWATPTSPAKASAAPICRGQTIVWTATAIVPRVRGPCRRPRGSPDSAPRSSTS